MTLLAVLALAGCAHKVKRTSELATYGALRGAKTKLKDIDPEMLVPLTAASTRAGVDALLAQLETAENQRRLQDAVMAATAAAVQGIAEQQRAVLVRLSDDMTTSAVNALATGLQGPLRDGIIGTTRTASASVVAGARDELASVFPECSTGDRRSCLEARISELSHAASLGVARGITDGLKSVLLAVAFLAGALVTLLVMLVVRGSRHAPHDAPGPGARHPGASPAPSY